MTKLHPDYTMVIMQHGLDKGAWAVPPQIFNSMVFVCIATCAVAPVVVQKMLTRWPQTEDNK